MVRVSQVLTIKAVKVTPLIVADVSIVRYFPLITQHCVLYFFIYGISKERDIL